MGTSATPLKELTQRKSLWKGTDLWRVQPWVLKISNINSPMVMIRLETSSNYQLSSCNHKGETFMLPMHDLDEPTKPYWNSLKRTTIKQIGFWLTYLCRPAWSIKSFHKGKMRSSLKSKDLEEDRRRTASMYLETLCRVLLLLVETCGRLLPPLKMMSSRSKAPPWLVK